MKNLYLMVLNESKKKCRHEILMDSPRFQDRDDFDRDRDRDRRDRGYGDRGDRGDRDRGDDRHERCRMRRWEYLDVTI